MPFSQKTLEFLFENRLRDSRDWYEEHKADYQKYVLEPLQALVIALAPAMLQIDGQLVTEPRVGRTISRIRRDTRFSRDKSLYRDHMWIIFKRGQMYSTELPGLYVEVGCDGFNYGAGFYDNSTGYMKRLRELVEKEDASYQRAQEAFAAQKVFQMEGSVFKRPRYAHLSPEKAQWMEHRSICFTAESSDLDLLFSDRLAARLIQDLRRLGPIYDFLLRVALAEQQEEQENAARSLGLRPARQEDDWE